MNEKEHKFWMGIRQVLIMALGLVEDLLGCPRSIIPRRKREHVRREDGEHEDE